MDIRGVGVNVIRMLGLEMAIRAATTGEEGVQWMTKDNVVWASFQAGADERSPTSEIEIMRGCLADICWKRSKMLSEQVEKDGGGIEYIFGDHLRELDQDGDKVHVRFARSGLQRTYDLVVGADGLQSQTRKLAWGGEGERDRLQRLGMYAAFFSIPEPRLIQCGAAASTLQEDE